MLLLTCESVVSVVTAVRSPVGFFGVPLPAPKYAYLGRLYCKMGIAYEGIPIL